MKKSPIGKLQKFSPRPFGGGSKRKLPIPDERTLMDMSLSNLEDLTSKIQSIINRKRKMDTLGYHRGGVYINLIKLLEGRVLTRSIEGKTPEGQTTMLSEGTTLTIDAIKSIEFKDIQFIEIGDYEIELEVHKALNPFRDKEGKLKV